MNSSYEFEQFLGKAIDVVSGGGEAWAVQSTGEKLAVALVLNRADWLAEMSYTIPEALERIGPTWAGFVVPVAKALHEDRARLQSS